MRIIADLHIHSPYSRAVSKEMTFENLDLWARWKGITVMGTGDFTHPAWMREIKEKLEPAEIGLYRLKSKFQNPSAVRAGMVRTRPNFKHDEEARFLLTVEISSIYSKGGKTRRIHNLIFVPSITSAEKINTALGLRGNIKSDGRPILGLDAKELTKIVFDVNEEAMVVPAHCLLPDTIVHTKNDLLKRIQDIQEGDLVLTHQNRWRGVQEILKRTYKGKVYHIKPRNFSLGLTTTHEHPFYAMKTYKNCHWSGGICKPSHENLEDCRNKHFKDYKPHWLMASQLERGDVLIFPRFVGAFGNHKIVNLKEIISQPNYTVKVKGDRLAPVGHKATTIKQFIAVDKNFCRLAGYYLAEGYTNSRDLIGFAFSSKEKKYVEEVINLIKDVFGLDKESKLKKDETGGIEVLFYSKILCDSFKNLFYSSQEIQNASTKALPTWMLGLSFDLQVEIFRCWWRGDSGYTTSRLLMNQMKIILLRLGIIPSIYFDRQEDYNARTTHFIGSRKINANYGLYHLDKLSFYEDKFNLLGEPEFAAVAKYNRGKKYGWMDENYIYLPIYDIQAQDYEGEVYNLEVEEDNSYTTEFATVHNCWTPWFSVFGSMSGFDSLEECFEEYAPHIYAVETGLSSDPEMNWRVSALDRIALISNSDSHSLRRIGREANVLSCPLSYRGIMEAIKSHDPARFLFTVEFFPEEGKYHYDGHRLCKFSCAPDQTKKLNNLCQNCGKRMTIGVMNRVDVLADRRVGKKSGCMIPFKRMVPLDEIIGESFGMGVASKKVVSAYGDLVKKVGTEFGVLIDTPLSDLASLTTGEIVEGIKRVREGNLSIKPGYDGEYGSVSIFRPGERAGKNAQASLFI